MFTHLLQSATVVVIGDIIPLNVPIKDPFLLIGHTFGIMVWRAGITGTVLTVYREATERRMTGWTMAVMTVLETLTPTKVREILLFIVKYEVQ